jgi:hypothetical protein
MIHSIFRDDEVIVALNGIPYTIDCDDPRYDQVCDCIELGDEEGLIDIFSSKRKYDKLQDSLLEFGINQTVTGYSYNGTPLPMDLSSYLYDAMDTSNVGPIIKFVEKLFSNPNHATRQHLFEFMDRNKMPIDKDGNFLAYKVVSPTYMDKHTGTMNNAPGSTLEVAWAQVDTNPEITCSRGLHCCALSYCSSFYSPGDKVVSVSVNPQDVGSIPVDYDGAKMRTRAYTVVSDITEQYLANHSHALRVDSNGLDPNREPYVRVARDYF